MQANKKIRVLEKQANVVAMEISPLLVLLAYALLAVITPRFDAYDASGPKFLSLSILNLGTFLFIMLNKRMIAGSNGIELFFRNRIGMVYTIFIGLVLLSFLKSVNIPESVLSFSKFFTVFGAVFNISLLLRHDKKYLKIIVITFSLLLLADSVTVFYNILGYISNQVTAIYEIKSVYSNKNILTAAMFVKVPFALWLITFEKSWLRRLGFVTLFCAELAIFFMSTRAFYLGLIVIAILFVIYIAFQGPFQKSANKINTIGVFVAAIILAFAFYSVIQRYVFTNKNDLYNKTFAKRVSSIVSGDSLRIDSWKRSATLTWQEPLLGVGTGNWKIRVLQYENQVNPNFMYMVKNHNDFFEIAAETGVVGGLLFISLFVLVILGFLKPALSSETNGDSIRFLFVPAFGIICYSLDAFFNFPADRPELQTLFSFFLGTSIAFTSKINNSGKKANKNIGKAIVVFFILLQLPAIYTLYLHTASLKIQRLAQADAVFGKLTHPASVFVEGFPSFFNLSSTAEPISGIKAKYLMNEGKFQEALDILQPDKSSPYDSRREYFMAQAYSKLGKDDSALAYAYKAYLLKPHFYDPCGFICFSLKKDKKLDEAIKISSEFIAREKGCSLAWQDLESLYLEDGNYRMAIQTIDSAIIHIPNDTSIVKVKSELALYRQIAPYQQSYKSAMGYFNQRNYSNALDLFDKIIRSEPGATMAYARRAVCYFNAREYQKCINDVNTSIIGGYNTPEIYNLRGAAHHGLGQDAEACEDFKFAADCGNMDAVTNMERICKKQNTK
ncbi:MAG: O-antigen ligase family protein [Bacteroidales bacterium]